MTDRPQFGAEYVETEFERIASGLDGPLTVYCIGGGAMSVRGLKDATKDVDLIVASSEDHGRLWSALLTAGYAEVEPLGEEYHYLGASSCVENDDGCRIDVFDRQVVDELVLTDGMKDRSERFATAGDLSVELLSLEDVFLFKAVANRATDVDDVNVLVQTGLDFEVIEDELAVQIDRCGHPLFATDVAEALGALEDRYGVTLPIEATVREYVESYYDALEVYLALDDPTPVAALRTTVDPEATDLEACLSTLEALGEVTVEDGIVHPNGDQ